MKWATRRHLKENPIVDLEVPAGESREGLITLDEYQQFLSFIRDPAFKDLVVTTWETGCRPQESLRVEPRHVDLTNQRWVFPQSESKNKKISRVVYLSDAAIEITRHLLGQNSSGKLFRNSAGKAWTTYAVNCAMNRV